MSGKRTIRQVVLLAYGEEGLRWLRPACRFLAESSTLRQLQELGLLQAWCIGRPPSDADRDDSWIEATAAESAPGALRGMLDRGRTLAARAELDADLLRILVLERWSLFSPASAGRVSLQKAFDAARRINCQPEGDPEYEVDWLSLVDGVRPATPPSPDAVTLARSLVEAAAIPERILYVDRVDQARAVVDGDAANQVFRELVRTLLTSELAFPERGQPLPQLLSGDGNDSEVIPFSFGYLRHSYDDLTRVQVTRLAKSLQRGKRGTDVASELSTVRLPAAVADDARMARTGQATFHSSRRLQREAATNFFYRLLARPSGWEELLKEIRGARAEVQRNFPDVSRTPGEPWVAGMAAVDPLGLGVSGVAVAAVALIVWRLTRRRGPVVQGTPTGQPDLTVADPQLGHAWLDLLGRLETAGHVIVDWLRRQEPTRDTWTRSSDQLMLAIALHGDPHPEAEPDPITGSLLSRVADEVARSLVMDEGIPDAEWLTAAFDRVARLDFQGAPNLTRALVSAALEGSPVQRAVQFVHGITPLIGPPLVPAQEVIWVSDPALELRSQLERLDPPGAPQRTHVDSDDTARSVRITFHQPTAWTRIHSLKVLFP